MLVRPQSIDLFRRSAEGSWVLRPIGESEEIMLDSLDFRCPVAVVYEDAELSQWLPI